MIGFKDNDGGGEYGDVKNISLLEGYLVATVIYWAIISVLNVIQSHLEKKINRIY